MPLLFLLLENNSSFIKQFDFQVKIKTLDRLTPISNANKAINNLLIFLNSQLFFCKVPQK